MARRETPVARATREMPPRPIAAASAAAVRRRVRSFRNGESNWNRVPISDSSLMAIAYKTTPRLCYTYFVTSPMCGDCHTPRDSRGQPDRTRRLRGATLPIRPKKESTDWADEAPDITASGLAGQWSEEEMIKFLTTGIDP